MTDATRERIAAKLLLNLPLTHEERDIVFARTKSPSKREAAILAEMKKRREFLCNGRETCHKCPEFEKIFYDGYRNCTEYVAVQMLSEQSQKLERLQRKEK